jgi:hypothetical protein
MAEKQAIFTVQVNTGNSVQDLQNADKAVKDLDKDLQKAQTTAKDNSGLDAYAQKLAELDAKLEAGGLSMREMTQVMKEYQNIAINTGSQSPIGSQALQNASDLKDRIGDLKAQTTALSSDFVGLDTAMAGIGTGVAVFQGVTSAVALTGIENEKLTQTMVKLQATQGLVNAVSTIANNLNKEAILGIQIRTALQKAQNFIMTGSVTAINSETASTKANTSAKIGMTTATTGTSTALKVLRGALISTGIGALIVGVGMLIANLDKLSGVIDWVADGFNWLTDAIGLTDNASEGMSRQDKKRTEQQIANIDREIEKTRQRMQARTDSFNKEDAQFGRQIALAKAQGKNTTDLERARIKASIQYRKDLVKENENIVKQTALQYELFKSTLRRGEGTTVFGSKEEIARLNELYKAIETSKRELAKSQEDLKDATNSLAVFEADVKKQQADDLKAQQKAQADAQKQQADNLKKQQDQQKQATKGRIDEARKQREGVISELEKLYNNEIKLADETEKQKIAGMDAGIQKEIALRQEEFNNYKEQFLIGATKEEKAELDKRFAEGSIKRQEYETAIANLRKNAISKLTEEEKALLTQAETNLRKDIQGINLKYLDEDIKNLAETEKRKMELREMFTLLITDEFDKETEELKIQQATQLKDLEEALKLGVITEEQFTNAKLKLQNELAEKEKEINKKKNDYIKEQDKKAREEQLKGLTDTLGKLQKGLDTVKVLNDLFNQIDQARINSLQKNRDEDLANLDAKMQAELNAENLTAEQKKQIEQNFAKQKYQVQLNAYNQEEKIKKAQFNRDKAIKLSQVAIDTASAIVKAIAEYGPPPSPLGIAGIATAGVIGITQAMAIANQQYKAGGVPSMPSTSTWGAGSSIAGASASSFTSTPNTTATAGLLGGAVQGTPTTSTQVFVLESDISATQNKVKLQESKTSW